MSNIVLDKKWYCTMKSNTQIKGGKWPKLTEALQHYCGRASSENAHDAMFDVLDCRDIFFAMVAKGIIKVAEGQIFTFLDTETTGFKKNGALIQAGQGRVCQLAMLMTNHKGENLAQISTMIKPDGWNVQEGAQKIHGFSDAYCDEYGINFVGAVKLYHHYVARSTMLVAHNADFDHGMMDIEVAYASAVQKVAA